MGMNLAAGLQAMGVDAAGHFAGRDKAPFRMMIGLPPALGATYLGTVYRRMWIFWVKAQGRNWCLVVFLLHLIYYK